MADVKMVKIVKIDHKGTGKSFRFFTLNGKGQVLTAKIDEAVTGYSEGMEVPASKLSLLALANEKQVQRYNSAKTGGIDTSLLA